MRLALPSVVRARLLDLSGQRAAWTLAWWSRFRAKAGRTKLDREEFTVLFGGELDRLLSAGMEEARDGARAALRHTAVCLLRRGVPLDEALLAATTCGDAARDVAEVDDGTADALIALERTRTAAYAEVFVDGERLRGSGCSANLGFDGAELPAKAKLHHWGLVGDSPAMARVRTLIEASARGAVNVLLTGESGTGKELAARAVHQAAGGVPAKFVAVNCAALPRHLVESELFGHVRGAFTGADGSFPGLIKAAEGGTLFLDEVTEMSMDVQAKLLRVLEEREIRPVGSLRGQQIDIRVVASTNREPQAAMAAGLFRHDLYYRLQSFEIALPALRDRRGDIAALVDHFLATFCSRRCGCIWGIAPDALAALCAVDWPGNVRELRNAVDYAVTTGSSGVLRVADFPPAVQARAACLAPIQVEAPQPHGDDAPPMDLGVPTLAEAEVQLAQLAVVRAGGNKVRAAQALGISRHKLYDLLKRADGAAAAE